MAVVTAGASPEVWKARRVAEAVGYSYETFRKIWRTLPDFPAPFLPRRWDPAAVIAWKAARSMRQAAATPAANDHHPRPAGRLAQLRAR